MNRDKKETDLNASRSVSRTAPKPLTTSTITSLKPGNYAYQINFADPSQ